MEMRTLNDVLVEELKDIYSAEGQILKALPKMAKKAKSGALRTAFENHRTQTQAQVERLDRIGELLGAKLTGKKCKAMEGLMEEGKEVLEKEGPDALIDTCLIAAAQRVEHYEISAYGTARAIAEQLGHDEVVELLQETLDEESETDEKLSMLSEEEILPASVGEEGGEEDSESDDESEDEAEDTEDEDSDDDETASSPAARRAGSSRSR